MLELTGAQKFKTKLAHVTSAEEEGHPALSSNHMLAMVFHSFHKGLFLCVCVLYPNKISPVHNY